MNTEKKTIIYSTIEGTISLAPSIWAEEDYKKMAEHLHNLAVKFNSIDTYSVDFFEGPCNVVCERKCYLKVCDIDGCFINDEIQLRKA